MDLRSIGKNFKRIDYDFDLISGKVNQVNYQKDSTDQFIHQYQYDADNRITNVLTTADGITWENEASYFYYRHGPLARIEIGQRQVQGIDYAYTLQGWIKGVNASTVQKSHDMGGDAYSFNGKHKFFGQDAYNYTLGYFENDYTRIYTGTNPNEFELAYAGKPFNAGSPSLYNGNIRHAVYGLPLLPNPTMGYAYNYDQLNRLVRMDAFKDAKTTFPYYEWKDSTATAAYQERISYDPNGNILKYLRNGQSSVLKMDSLKYSYYANTNKLAWVHDSVGASNYAGKIDIDNQATGNYTYDAIGNLTTDASEGITIWWNNYGKIDSISNSKDTTALRYRYDAMGNRIEKRFYKLASDSSKYTEYYVRDAQGNIMANYKQKAKGVAALDSLRLTELPIYGSSRLGVYNRDTLLYTNASGKIGTKKDTVTFTEGKKQYELSNHLGNVLVTITDRKYPQDDNNDSIADWYSPIVLTETDFYPFGMPMPERSNSTTAYRFGFNGKENDNEVKGAGNQQDYGMRIYDTRLGRFLSIDPLASKFPFYTPFQFSGNSPIVCIDIDGLENIYYGEGLKFNESSAMIIANNSSVYNDLVKQFQNTSATNNQEVNVGWDLLIIKAPTASGVGANTAHITTDELLIHTPKELNGYEETIECIKNDPNKKGLIVVVIKEENADAADIVAGNGNWATAASIASDLDHELDCHVIDIALGRPNRNSDEQHIDYYSQKGKAYVPLKYNESPANPKRDYPNSRGGITVIENENISQRFTGKKFAPIQKMTPITDVQISK